MTFGRKDNGNQREKNPVAEETDFIRDNLERAMRLVDLLETVFRSPFLDRLVLKGGTAINLFYAGMPRLSVDIDLDYVGLEREAMLSDKSAIKEWLTATSFEMGYRVLGQSKETHALDSFVLSYVNAVGNPDAVKIEINYLDRAHVLPLEKKSPEVFGYSSKTHVTILAKDEICFSKRFAAKEYLPVLLFGDSDETARVAAHPMALWRTKSE